jgi:hypothetical protein
MARTSKASLMSQGAAAFARAIQSLGHRVMGAAEETGGDLVVTVDGIEVLVDIKAVAVVNPETADRLLASVPTRRTEAAQVVVGDLITGSAREALRDAGWGWLDRRGHVVLRAKGVHIDAEVPADDRQTATAPPRPISGTAGISWAAALLMAPEDPPSMREVARRVSLSHSAIVAAAKRLRDASLVRTDRRPLVPELFWALADEWHPRPIALAQLPPPGDAGSYAVLGVNLDEPGPGWAVAGTVGAAVWGAPTAIGSAVPLDLAQDRARGTEILADWQPKDVTRVG